MTPNEAGGAELGGERSGPYSNYGYAMLAVYGQRSVALAVELFETTYRRSIEKYRSALNAFTPFFVIFPADMSVSFCPAQCDGRVRGALR